MIEIKNLQKFYDKGKRNEQHVLKGINLSLPETGLVCLLGESGCGKTTLLNTIGGLDEFSGGEISVDDVTVKGYDPKRIEPLRNEHFGYIFQNYYLLKDYTVSYNVKLALSRYDLTEEEKDARVDYCLGLLGMAKYKKKPVSKLSGGQQQRVSIARALIKSPDIILADEPTGNLDEENTLRTMSILKSISKTCLVLLVTHERRIADFFADRIIEIKDGQIVRDETAGLGGSYERSDDANIYLKEFESTKLESDLAEFNIYCKVGEEPPKIRFNLAWKDGKLYLQNATQVDLILEGEASGVRVLDTERPKFDEKEMDKITYELERPTGSGNARLSAKEIWKMATENIGLMGKKQTFVLAILVVTAILLSIVSSQYVDSKLIDKYDFVTTDDHYLAVSFTKVSSLRTDDERAMILEFIEEYLADGDMGTLIYLPSTGLYLLGDGFVQMESMRQILSGYSFAQLDDLDEASLIYGEMPTARNEIVVDISIVEKWMESGGVLTSAKASVQDFVGLELYANASGEYVKIVGICDTDEPDVYASKSLLLCIGKGSYSIMSVDELNVELGESYSELGDYEIYMREGLLTAMGYSVGDELNIYDDEDITYTIVGTYSDDADINYVVSEYALTRITELAIYSINKSCMLYISDDMDMDEIAEILEDYGKDYRSYFNIELSVPYEDEMESYMEARNVDMDAKTLIAVLIAVVSLVMIYFTMKSNATSRSEELTVYRLIGISRASIVKAYVLEMLLITSMTSLPAVILTTGVMKFISAVPSLSIDFNFPIWCIALLLCAIYAVHAIISMLPVWSILKQPPAALAVKQ